MNKEEPNRSVQPEAESLFETSPESFDFVQKSTLEKEAADLRKQLADANERGLRAEADKRNAVLRAEREAQRFKEVALKEVLSSLLPVLDSLDQGMAACQGEDELIRRIHEGMVMTANLLLGNLKKFGLEMINPMGERFNPEFHEAMMAMENETVEPDTVLQVLQKGYLLNKYLLRAARVIVSKKA